METPKFNHISKKDFEKVYEPAEDSFLLLDAIESDLNYIKNVLKPRICLEIGSGSGIIITALSKILFKSAMCISTDINNFACKITKDTAIKNLTVVDVVNANLANCFRNNVFDLIIFNPPYVVTSDDECANKTENALVFTWAGGTDGRLIINKFLKNLPKIISKNGVAYLLLLKQNKPCEIIEELNKKGFIATSLMERRIIGEHLYVVKIQNN